MIKFFSISPSIEPFNEAKYKALMDGLDIKECKFSEVMQATDYFRLEADYFTAQNLQGGNIVPAVKYINRVQFAFYETYRFEHFPNAKERREVISQLYIRARELGDNNVYFLDGEMLCGDKDREICTVERLHPNDLGFYRIAERIYEIYKKIDKTFS